MDVPKPLMVFDGDCGFCRSWIGRWRQLTGESVDYAPYQECAGRFPEIPPASFKRSVQFIEPGGKRSQGAEAVFRSLAYAPQRGWMLWCYEHVPLAALIAEAGYRLVASHRVAGARVTRFLWGDHLELSSYRISSWLFVRGLALIYLVAFASLWSQVDGLIGSRGILPLGPYLDAVRHSLGPERYQLLPTLSWLNPGDAVLHILCSGGVLLSLLLLFGIAPSLCLILLWVCYLSLVVDCRAFLGFQWDALLLEAGFLAIFLVPFRWRERFGKCGYSVYFQFLIRWLLFRLVFSSGMVKLLSGDSSWRHFTALRYHFETQPLPTWIGWYAAQLPDIMKTAMTVVMFVIELLAPVFVFAPRRLRLAACALLVLLQAAIALTGNYAFFNYLTIALCLLTLDDSSWPSRWRRRAAAGEATAGPSLRLLWFRGVAGTITLVLTAVSFSSTLRVDIPWPQPVGYLYGKVAPLRTFDGYGLFAIMTRTRPEIIVEGSNDGETWMPYEFRWKPGDLRRRPGFIAPFQPRLDWQMWFAALENYESNAWFVDFMARILEGSPPVLRLLAYNPFPAHPPRFVRALLFEYHFTSLSERADTGGWWKRTYLGVYFPASVSTRDQRNSSNSR